MSEIEDQLRALAEHRASQVAPYDASMLAMRRRNRTPLLVGAVAAAVVIALVASALALWPDDDARSVHVIAPSTTDTPSTAPITTPPTPTTTPETAGAFSPVAGCAEEDWSTDPRTHVGTPEVDGRAPSIRVASISTSSCLDVVALSAGCVSASVVQPCLGSAEWSIGYDESSFVDQNGAPVAVAGKVHLVIRGTPTTFTDDELVGIGGVPSGLSSVRELRYFASRDGTPTWVLGLDAVVPFSVVEGAPTTVGYVELAIHIPTRAPRQTCQDRSSSYSVSLPQGWFTDVLRNACGLFAPDSFRIYADSNWHLVHAGFVDYDPAENPSTVIVSDRMEAVAGHDARVVEVEWTNDHGLGVSVGTRDYYWIIDVGGRRFVVSVLRGPGPEYDALKAGADQLARSVRFP